MMKKFTMVFALLALIFSATQVQATNYRVDEAQVDAMFDAADQQEVTSVMNLDLDDFSNAQGTDQVLKRKDPIIAFVLCWFVGYLGVHRMYLGTATMTWVGYILTGGGCGIVVTVDWVLLLIGMINDDIRQYVNNTKFFMW